jgi:urease accessory protein
VQSGALLVVAPDPVLCFAGARYRQVQRYHVARDSALVVSDCLLSGRRAAGERWAFEEYRSLLEVTVGDRLLVHDALALRADDGELAERLGRFDALAVAIVIGRALRGEADRLVQASVARAVARRADLLMTATGLAEDGCLVRVAGTSADGVCRALREALQFVPERLGDNPWARKW